MDFAQSPKLFINEYYNDKKNQIDFNCENAILNSKEETDKEFLNIMRLNFIEKIESVKQMVFGRLDAAESKYTKDMFQKNAKEIKDEVFIDLYCQVLDAYHWFPINELKIGFILFTEFDDQILDGFR